LLAAKRITQLEQDSLISDLVQKKSFQNLSKTDEAIATYALKLTRSPNLIDANDINALRKTGHNDRAIHDICTITAYFAFVNRIADGLGVQLEERFPSPDSK